MYYLNWLGNGAMDTDNGRQCYHLWVVADGGNAMFRRRRCFTSRTAANKARKTSGFSVATDGKAVSVMQCMPECPCKGNGCPAL